MPVTLDGKLVLAVTSMALFDFSEADRVFQAQGAAAFRAYQKERLEDTAEPGVAFNLVRKLLRLNRDGQTPVEVFVVSRNDPFSGLRVFNSAKSHNLPITRGLFTSGRSQFPYLRAIRPTLFLSESEEDVRSALNENFAAARVGASTPAVSAAHPNELRIALDGDGVLFDDMSEQVFTALGLPGFLANEAENARVPMGAGPL